MNYNMSYKEKLKEIKALVFDVDGVFTNGKVYLESDGSLGRKMDVKDGFAVQYAVRKNIPMGIISGGKNEKVRTRFKDLGITDVYLDSQDKLDDFKDFYFKYDLKPTEILYMGDDILDLEVMRNCGLAACPADAVPEVKREAHYISPKNGGDGCVRDVIEQLLKIKNLWV